jgi:CRISPR/Cas system CSM-associated protein Csm2 small subunit
MTKILLNKLINLKNDEELIEILEKLISKAEEFLINVFERLFK